MSAIDNGGPAFPEVVRTHKKLVRVGGMRLRDYIAAKVVAGISSNTDWMLVVKNEKEPLEGLAHTAYEIADAMLKMRQQRPPRTPENTIAELTEAELATLTQDANRFRWLRDRFTGYDFYFGGKPDAEDEEGKGKVTANFEVGQSFRGGRDITAAIDDAMSAAKEQP